MSMMLDWWPVKHKKLLTIALLRSGDSFKAMGHFSFAIGIFFRFDLFLGNNCSESVRYRFSIIPKDHMSPKTDDFRQRMAILSLNPFPSNPDDTALLTRPNERLGRFRHALATCTCQIPSGGNVPRSKCPILIGTTTNTALAESVQIGPKTALREGFLEGARTGPGTVRALNLPRVKSG